MKKGKGLERVLLQVEPDKPVSVIVGRESVTKFNIWNSPRERVSLVIWLRSYSAKQQKAAVKVGTLQGNRLL